MAKNDVMVVHGRDLRARDDMFGLLGAVGLNAVEWPIAVSQAGGGSPYTGAIVATAIREAGAVVVLITGDDEARLSPGFLTATDGAAERNLTPQARANVILELGMALMIDESKTIIVQLDPVRPISDILGRNVIHVDSDPKWRHALIERLKRAGCEPRTNGDYWLRAGFDHARPDRGATKPNSVEAVEVPPPKAPKTAPEVPECVSLSLARSSSRPGSGDIFDKIEPKTFFDAFIGVNQIEGTRRTKHFVGKWLKVVGPLVSAQETGKQVLAMIYFTRQPNLGVGFFLEDAEAIDRIALVRPGESIAMVGQIHGITANSLTLYHAELVAN